MNVIRRFLTVGGRTVVALLVATAAAAAAAAGICSFVIILGIIETPDPIEYESMAGNAPWSDVDVNGDGTIDLDDATGVDLAAGGDGRVFAVWSAGSATDHDVRFAELTMGRWLAPVVLAGTTADELAPAVSVAPNGDIHAIWQEDGEPGVIVGATRRAAAGTWGRSRVLVNHGQAPTVTAYGAQRVIAYERRGLLEGWEIVAAVESASGAFVPVVIGVSDARGSRRIDLGVAGERLWVQWQHTDQSWGVAEYVNGDWVAPKTRPWDGLSWGAHVTVASSD